MALKDQPYLPLYIQDVLTDEKLMECSASAHGIYFRLMCILHKQETYGLLCLKQKHKQKSSKEENFASMLCKQMPFPESEILFALKELSEEKVICISETELSQKRMVKDGELSLLRTQIGKTGGSNVTKQYNKAGFLYLMSDGFSKNKIGVSVNPQNRLYRLRSDLGLPKHFEIKDVVNVKDMGGSEDLAQSEFGNKMDGEWIICEYAEAAKIFDLLKAKVRAKTKANYKAKPQANTEDENESENEGGNENKNGIKKPPPKEIIYPFDSENFLSMWANWKEYKKIEHDFKYKSIHSEQGALNKLVKLAEGHESACIEIIRESIANGWLGLFKLKNENNGKHGYSKNGSEDPNAAYKQYVAAKLAANGGNNQHEPNTGT